MLCRPGWPWTHRDSPASGSRVLGLKVLPCLLSPCYQVLPDIFVDSLLKISSHIVGAVRQRWVVSVKSCVVMCGRSYTFKWVCTRAHTRHTHFVSNSNFKISFGEVLWVESGHSLLSALFPLPHFPGVELRLSVRLVRQEPSIIGCSTGPFMLFHLSQHTQLASCKEGLKSPEGKADPRIWLAWKERLHEPT